jgi:hypothetical protein
MAAANESRKASEKEQEPEKVAAEAVAETEPSEDAPVHSVERLTGPDAYDLTGYEPHIVAGALAGVSKKNLTAEEAKAAVKAWLKAPVKEA